MTVNDLYRCSNTLTKLSNRKSELQASITILHILVSAVLQTTNTKVRYVIIITYTIDVGTVCIILTASTKTWPRNQSGH